MTSSMPSSGVDGACIMEVELAAATAVPETVAEGEPSGGAELSTGIAMTLALSSVW